MLRSFTQFISYSKEVAELKTMYFHMLLYIFRGPQNISALAKGYLMTKRNVSMLVDYLENKSYV
ncbi:MAG: MarR family transcriptional regulator [Kosmotogaceae bacterium]|nr:MarR family transcriptional regulator [Kosmotogaceae bacterium]